MSGVNKVIVVGRLGGDPEQKTVGQNTVTNFSVATSEKWKGKDGNDQERTEWHRIVVWGKLAEICGKHLAKGRQVYVEGRLQTRNWEDQQGVKRYTTEIVAQTVQFLGSNPNANGGAGADHSAAQDPGGYAGGGFDQGEEIPF